MEALTFFGAIILGPLLSLLTEYMKRRFGWDGALTIAILSLLIGLLYVGITLAVPEEHIKYAISLAGMTGFSAMSVYNFATKIFNNE